MNTGAEPALCPGTGGQRNGECDCAALALLTLTGRYNRPYIVLQFSSTTRLHISCRGRLACQT